MEKPYTAVVTLSDSTNSAISTSTAVTYDTINPTPITTNPWTLSNIPAGQSALRQRCYQPNTDNE
ncbi:MAG: hypothetical protein H0A76_00290 [Candidatus Thiodubiliella endoseptemdiera]|uniref:Uncharacterized protein n=1 Tax=Candidatus Thiodubiliella endoseptemdiera TaxID=2738886 RepID=A0A853EYQ7_9GAMM|nr:hypothetical protein [Candidatus Thiodubiliella endoseptemdiera]